MLHHGCPIDERAHKRHRQISLAKWQSLAVELADARFHVTQRNSRESGAVRLMKVIVNIESVKSGVGSRERWAKTETLLDPLHEREEVGEVGMVECLGAFGQDKLTNTIDLGHDSARGIAPIILADADLF